MKCKYCQSESFYYAFVPFKKKQVRAEYLEWGFHIKRVCGVCHKFNGFAKQTDELMAELKNAVFLPGFDLTDRTKNTLL